MRSAVNRSSKRFRIALRSSCFATRRGRRRVDVIDMKPVTILDDLGHRAAPECITGVPFAIASISTSPNGSGQSIGNSNATASPRNPPSRSRRSRR